MERRSMNMLLMISLGASLVLSTSAWSGTIDDAYNSMGMYSNTTMPAAFQGQAANYYTGGSFFLRDPTQNYRLITWDPPKYRGGCGGIDAYMGSFSHINLDGFIAMLKNIGSNASGLAFELALDELSSLLGADIKHLSDTLSKLSQTQISSCKAARAVVASFSDKYQRDREDVTQSFLKGFSIFPDDDSSQANSAVPAQQNVADTAAMTDPTTKETLPLGNIVWKALVLKGPTNFTEEDRLLAISLVGTFIVTKDPVTLQPHFSEVSPSGVTFEMVMMGNMQTGVPPTTSNGLTAGTLDYLPVLVCDAYVPDGQTFVGADACVYSRTQTDSTTGEPLTGMDVVWLNTLYNGTGQIPYLQRVDDQIGNIMNNITIGQQQQGAELDLIASTDLPVYKMAAVATAMPGGGQYFREKYAGLIAADRASKYYESLLDAAHNSLIKFSSSAPASFHDHIAQIMANEERFRRQMYEYMTKMKMDANNANVMAEELIVAERKLFTHMSPQLRNNYAFGH